MFSISDRVYHETYGAGTVSGVSGKVVTVKFDSQIIQKVNAADISSILHS